MVRNNNKIAKFIFSLEVLKLNQIIVLSLENHEAPNVATVRSTGVLWSMTPYSESQHA